MGVADGNPSTARSHIFVCLKDSSRAAKEQVHLPFKKNVVSATTFDWLVQPIRIAVLAKSSTIIRTEELHVFPPMGLTSAGVNFRQKYFYHIIRVVIRRSS